MTTVNTLQPRRVSRLYARLYRQLMNFIDNASIAEKNLVVDEYVRAENLILKQIWNSRVPRPQLSRDDKILLARKAINLRKWHTNKISLLSPGQIAKYANYQPGRSQTSLGPTSVPKKTMSSLDYQKEILEILDEHPNWGKQQILAEMQKNHPSIDRVFIWELLFKMGFWDIRRRKEGIQWKAWVKKHEGVTWGGDFFSVYVWTKKALIQYFVLFFIHLKTLRVVIAGITPNATEEWLINILKSWTDGTCPLGEDAKFLIRDRDRLYTKNVDWYFASMGISPIKIAAGAPVMNCVSEQFVNNIKHDCLSHCVFFSGEALRQVIALYVEYYHKYRPHKKHNGGFIMPSDLPMTGNGEIKKNSILPGLLTTYYRS